MQTERIIKHNFLFMILEGMVYYIGMSFIQTDTVIAEFIDIATHSAAMIGLAGSISSFGFLLGQVIAGAYFHRLRSQSAHMVKVALATRGIMLIFSSALALGLRGRAAAWLFLLFYTIFMAGYGMIGLCFQSVAARTLPVRKRGEMLGMQQTVCGFASLATGVVLQKLLTSALGDYAKFSIIFAIAGGMFLLSVAFLGRVEDLPHPSHPEQPVKTPVRYAKDLIPLFHKSRGVRMITLSRCLYAFTLISLPLNFSFGQANGLTEHQLATLVYMPIAGRIIAGILWSQMSRLMGYPAMMMAGHILGLVTALLNFAAFGMAAAGKSVMLPLCAAMLLVNINSQAGNGYSQHMIAIVDEESRASYIVLLAVICAPLAFSTTLAGYIADNWGYLPVYIIMAAASVIGIFQTWHYFFSRRSPLPVSERHGAQ